MDKVTHNHEEILNKYRQGNPAIRMLLSDGGEVLGEAVNEVNNLLYIIRHNGVLTIEKAQNKKIAKINELPKQKIKCSVFIDGVAIEDKKEKIPKP